MSGIELLALGTAAGGGLTGGTLGAGLMAAGATAQAVGTVGAGVQARRASRYNARLIENEAERERAVLAREYRDVVGAGIASAGASGISSAVGSPLAVQSENAFRVMDEMRWRQYVADVSADARRYSGDQRFRASLVKAAGGLAQSAGTYSLFQRGTAATKLTGHYRFGHT